MDNMEINFKELLKEKGYKITVQRQAVLDILIEHEGEHITTEQIYDFVKVSHPEIGLATVYRTVLLMDDLKIIERLDLDDGYARYELNKHKQYHRHHHLICMKCGTVAEVEEDLLDSLEEQIQKQNNFIVKDHRVKFYGYCNNCAEE